MSFNNLRLGGILKWYMKGGLFDVLSLILAALVLLGLWHALSQSHSFLRAQWLWVVLDSLLWPLYALQAAMHVMRDERTTVFEINLMGDSLRVAAGRILAFLLSQVPIGVIVYLALLVSNTEANALIIVVKITLYVTTVSLALPLMSKRASFFLLLTFYMLLPFMVPVLVKANLVLGSQRLDPITAVIAIATAPFYMYATSKVLPLPYTYLALIAIVLLSILALLSIILFSKAEYNV